MRGQSIASQATVQMKLLGCFAIILCAVLGNSVYSLLSVHGMRTALQREVLSSGAALDDARQITIAIANMRSAMRGISMFGMMHNSQHVAASRTDFDQSNRDAVKAVEDMSTQNLTAEDRALVDGIRSRLAQWRDQFGQFADLSASGHATEASELTLKQTSPIMDWVQKTAADLGSRSRERQQRGNQAMGQSMNHREMLDWTLVLLMLAGSVATWRVVSRLVVSLKEIAQAFIHGAQEVLSASCQVSSASQTLAQQSSEQAASIEETSASTQQISSMAQQNSEKSRSTAAIAGEAGRRFTDMNGTLDEMVAGMDAIHGSSNKISKIIKVIDEIAFQTNILALNAAVEAARAGEAGMGFAVVADEVRNLAQRSAQAAKDTAELIEESISRSNTGKQKVDGVADAVRATASEVQQAKVLADQVSLGSDEQLRGIQEISKAIAQMEHTTQATAANAEESAAASEELKAQSETLTAVAQRMSSMLTRQ